MLIQTTLGSLQKIISKFWPSRIHNSWALVRFLGQSSIGHWAQILGYGAARGIYSVLQFRWRSVIFGRIWRRWSIFESWRILTNFGRSRKNFGCECDEILSQYSPPIPFFLLVVNFENLSKFLIERHPEKIPEHAMHFFMIPLVL